MTRGSGRDSRSTAGLGWELCRYVGRLKDMWRKLIVLGLVEVAAVLTLVGVASRWLPWFWYWRSENGISIGFPDEVRLLELRWDYCRDPSYQPNHSTECGSWKHTFYLGRYCGVGDRPGEKGSEAPVGRPDDRPRRWCSGMTCPIWTPVALALLYPCCAAIGFARRCARGAPSSEHAGVMRRRGRVRSGLVVVSCQIAMFFVMARMASALGR